MLVVLVTNSLTFKAGDSNMPDLGCWGGYIVPPDENGYCAKSALLYCVKCRARGFHTKNIGYIGARTIYEFPGGCQWIKEHMNAQTCNCDGSLEIDTELMEHVKNCQECQQFGH